MTPEQIEKLNALVAESPAEEEPVDEGPEVYSPAKHVESKKKRPSAGQTAVDLATVGTSAFTFGIPQWWDTATGGISNQLKGVANPFQRARQEAFGPIQDAKSRLTPLQNLGASMAGGWQKRSGAGILDAAFQAGGSARRAPSNLRRFLGKPAGQAAAGGVGGTLDGYLEGDFSFEDAAKNGAFGAVAAPAMQAIVGDFALPLLKKGVQSLGVVDDLGGALDLIRSTGKKREGSFTTENIIKKANELPPGSSVLDIDTSDEWSDAAEASKRFHNAVAELNFGKVKDTEVNTKAFKYNSTMYNKALERVTQVAKNANDNARADVVGALRAPESRVDALYQQKGDLKAAKDVMARISDQSPGALGATKIDMRSIVGDLNDDVARAFKAFDDDGNPAITYAPEGARSAMRKFNTYVRDVELNPAALTTHRVASEGQEKLQEGVDAFAGGNLARLYNARKDFASDMLSPESTATPAERKAAVAVLKEIDKVIEQHTLGAAGKSRGAFAKAMRMEEAYDVGQSFYKQRMGEFADDKTFAKHYGESVKSYMENLDDDDLKEMFRAGFSKGMSDTLGTRGFLTEMNYLVGDYVSSPTAPTFFQQNEGGVELLRTMLGDKDTDAILQVLDEGRAVAEFSDQLATLLAAKGDNPRAGKIIGDATEGVLQHQSIRNRESGAWNAALTSLNYITKPGDRQKARALIRLMAAETPATSNTIEMSPWYKRLASSKHARPENLNKLLNTADEQLNMLPVAMGARGAGMVTDNEAYKENKKEEVGKASREIQDYLDSLKSQ